MSKRSKKRTKVLRDSAFHQVKLAEPKRVAVTRKRHGKSAARRMSIAIALDDARAQGAKIPKPKKRRR